MHTSMKAIAFALLLTTSFAFAQTQPIPNTFRQRVGNSSQSDGGQTLKENYIVTLTITEKDAPVTEYSIVVATLNFSTTFPDSRQNTIGFQGTLVADEGGSVLLSYVLNSEVAMQSPAQGTPVVGQPVQFRNYSTQSSVRLQPGDNVVVVKNDTRTCKLALARVADTKGK